MKAKKKDLMGALPIIAAMLGDKLGVKVVVGDYNPITDGKTIYLPSLADDDPDMVTLAIGYIDHEAAHIRYTEFDLDTGSEVEHRFTNILEDYRIEKRLGSLFPGARNNLLKMYETILRKGLVKPLGEDDPPGVVITRFMLDTVFARLYGGDLLVDMRNKSEEIFRRRFPAGVFTRLAALLEEVDKMVDTSDANKLAKRILKMLKDEQEKQQQQRQQRSGDANGDPASDKDDGDAIQGQNPQRDGQVDEPDQSGDTRGQDDGQDDDARDTGAGGSTPQDQQGRGAGAEGTEDDHDVIQQVLDAGEDELPDDLGDVLKRVLNAAKDNSCNTTMAKSHRPETLGKETRLMEIASAATVQLRTRLANLVQAQRWNRLETRRTGRILDTRRLYRSQAGDNRIFLRRNESVAPNTAVQILLDRSGSMCGQRIEVGQQAVLAAALAMESITGTVVQTAAFPYGEDDVDVLVLTAFGERVQNTSAAYQLLGDGGTPLAEAMLWAGHELIKREEPRKILLVATDGDPDDSCAVIDLVERFQESGIEVYALGIQSHKGASLFPNHRIIQRLSDLPAAMIGMLQEAILKRAA